MNKKTFTVLLLVIVALAGYIAFRPAPVPQAGSAGPTHSFTEYFLDGSYQASLQDLNNTIPTLQASPSAATSSTRTLTAKELCENPTVDMAFGIATGTLTFPSAANLITNGACLSTPASRTTFAIRNTTTTATAFITYAAGASSSIAVGRDDLTSTTTAGAIATFELRRVTSSSAPWIIITQRTWK